MGVWPLIFSMAFLRRAIISCRALPGAPRLDRRALGPHRGGEALTQHRQGGPGFASHQKIRLERAERIACEQRVRPEADDLRARLERMGAWDPRHGAVEHR